MSLAADLETAAWELAATAAQTLDGAIGAVGTVGLAPPGPVQIHPAHVVVLVPTRGDLSGVTWVVPVAIATALAHRMAPGFECDLAMLEASACELANILTGRASDALEVCGVRVELAAPRVVAAVADGPTCCVDCDLGTLTVALHAEAA